MGQKKLHRRCTRSWRYRPLRSSAFCPVRLARARLVLLLALECRIFLCRTDPSFVPSSDRVAWFSGALLRRRLSRELAGLHWELNIWETRPCRLSPGSRQRIWPPSELWKGNRLPRWTFLWCGESTHRIPEVLLPTLLDDRVSFSASRCL